MTLKKQEAEKEQRKGSIPVCQRASSLDIFSELLLPCSNYQPGAEIASNLSPTNISEHVLVVSKCSCTADQTGNEATYPTSQRGHTQTSIISVFVPCLHDVISAVPIRDPPQLKTI